MILIADSSALVALSIVNQLDILEKLFGKVYVPRAVYEEVSKNNKVESYNLTTYCKDKVLDIQSSANFNISLGRGESESIVLYTEQNADFLLCDDKKAKKFAQSFGLKVIGSLGILLKAKETKLIDEITPLIEILKESRIFIDNKTYALVLRMSGEL
jgi:predicted nucleic acid-binding protein